MSSTLFTCLLSPISYELLQGKASHTGASYSHFLLQGAGQIHVCFKATLVSGKILLDLSWFPPLGLGREF